MTWLERTNSRSSSAKPNPWARHLPFVILTLVFVGSRAGYRAIGVTFDATPLGSFLQYMPMWLIEHDFWRSLLYLHQQPPLQNLLAGGIYRWLGPQAGFRVLEAVYVAFGFTLAHCQLASLLRLGVRSWLSTLLVSLVTVSPAAVLYENWLFYHQPVAALLAFALWALVRFYEKGTVASGALFFSALGIAAEFRSVYGPLWVAAIAAGLCLWPPGGAARGRPRRTILLAAAVPILVITALNMRTFFLIGQGMGSAMAWSNLPRKVWRFVPAGDKEGLVSSRVVSEEILYEPFPALHRIERLRLPHPETGVPLLDDEEMPDGEENVHTLEYVLIVDRYYKPDAIYLIGHYPGAYLRSIVFSLGAWYCASSTRDIVLGRSENTKRVLPIETVVETSMVRAKNGRLDVLAIGLPVCLLYAIYRMARARPSRATDRAAVAATFFMTFTIAYAGLGTSLISFGDFSRYRYDVDAFYLALFAMLMDDALSRVRRRRRATAIPSATT